MAFCSRENAQPLLLVAQTIGGSAHFVAISAQSQTWYY
jgi:hypothetical protein